MLTLKVASPCTEKWELMAGDARTRRCERCALNVFNVSELSEDEMFALFAKANGGRVCGRIFQRRDGTVVTKDCPVGVARLRRRVLVAITTSLALVIAAFMARPLPHGRGGAIVDLVQRVRATAGDTEAWLRGSATFGPLVEWLDPAPVMMMGDIAPAAPPSP
jgi:hypothetical protein